MYKVEAVRVSDIDAILDIQERSELSPWTRDAYLAEIGRPEAIFLRISHLENECCGFVLGRIIPSSKIPDRFDAEIYNVGVEPEMQKKGFGNSLLSAFIAKCKERDVIQIWLDVRESNHTARRFYKKCGFEAATVRKSFYQNPVEDAIIMSLNDLSRASN